MADKLMEYGIFAVLLLYAFGWLFGFDLDPGNFDNVIAGLIAGWYAAKNIF